MNIRKKKGKNKILMSCQGLAKGPDAAGNLIMLSTQQQPCEHHNACTATVFAVKRSIIADDKAKD